MENCRMCKFWRNAEPMKISPDAQGACRRFPPIPMIVPMPHPTIKGGQIIRLQSNYAGTRAKDWCGEFIKSDLYKEANASEEQPKAQPEIPLVSAFEPPAASGDAQRIPPVPASHQE